MPKKSAPKRPTTKRLTKAPINIEHTEEQRHRAAKKLGEQEQHWWTYDDLVRLTGKTRNTIYKHVDRGTIDPGKLESVLYWVARNGKPEVKRKLLEYALQPWNSKNPADE